MPLLPSQKSVAMQARLSAQVVGQAARAADERANRSVIVVGGRQLPTPSQLAALVWVVPKQLKATQTVALEGKLQAPVPSQSVALQVASPVEQVALQQWPLPVVLQMPFEQASLVVQTSPAASCARQTPLPPQ